MKASSENSNFEQEKEQFEEALRVAQERLSLAVSAAGIGYWSWDIKSDLVTLDETCATLLNIKVSEEISGKVLLSKILTNDLGKIKFAANKALVGEAPRSTDFRIILGEGEIRWLSGMGNVVRDSHDSIKMTGILIDVTERKSIEKEREYLLDAERAARLAMEKASSLKDEFLATLSHELRTPLNAILGWAQLLHRTHNNDQKLVEGLAVIERSARVQAQLIEDLLDMSRIISGKINFNPQPLNLGKVLMASIATMQLAADFKKIKLVYEFHLKDLKTTKIKGDSARIQQIFSNLLSNAIKFSPPGSQIFIGVDYAVDGVSVSIRDQGIGIRPDSLEVIFDRFRQGDGSITKKFGGLGLGLSIVKHLAVLHGGTVVAESSGEGLGSCITVKFPLYREEEENLKIEENQRAKLRTKDLAENYLKPIDNDLNELHPSILEIENIFKHLTILVLDEEKDAQEMVKRILEEAGAKVLLSKSPSDAIQKISQEKPALIISDISMSEIDGYNFIKSVRGLGAENGGVIPAIALTAFARPEDKVKALDAGFQAHVAKPINTSQLIATIAALFGITP